MSEDELTAIVQKGHRASGSGKSRGTFHRGDQSRAEAQEGQQCALQTGG